MTDSAATSDIPTPDSQRGLPITTMIATLLGLFLFVGLVLIAYNSPNYLGDAKPEPKADPAAKLKEIQARNQAILEGKDSSTKMSVAQAMGEVVERADASRSKELPNGKLPFPIEPPSIAAPKSAEKK